MVFLLLARNKNSRPGKPNTPGLSKIIREGQLRVLIIDDEDRFREAMSFNLTELYGATVKAVESGSNAINHLKAGNSYEVIFLDLKLPGMDGIETYHRLRDMKVVCPIVMMSAYPDSEKWEQAKQLDVALIPKPFPEKILIEILGNISR
jgi:CheY-like chemotaxis protein